MKKVVKFGGSSLANAEQFQKVGDIIRSDESRRYVVPSAPGKRFDEDIKVTDMLYGCYDAASKGEDITEKINAIKARYYEIIKGLGLSLSLEEEFKKIDEDFRAQAGIQYAASRGEFLNGKIMAAYLGYDFVDAASVIVLIKLVIWKRRRPINSFPKNSANPSMRLFRDFTAHVQMAR